MEAVLKAAVKIEEAISAGLALEVDWVQVVGKLMVVEAAAEGMQMVEEEEVAMRGVVVVVVVVMERMEVEVGVVKKVRVGVEEENLEAKVENLLPEGETLKKYLKQILSPYLKTVVEHLFQNHLQSTTFHPLDAQKHLPFQVPHPRPLRCNGACHLGSLHMLLPLQHQVLIPSMLHHWLLYMGW